MCCGKNRVVPVETHLACSSRSSTLSIAHQFALLLSPGWLWPWTVVLDTDCSKEISKVKRLVACGFNSHTHTSPCFNFYLHNFATNLQILSLCCRRLKLFNWGVWESVGAQHMVINAWMNYSEWGKHQCPLKEGVRRFYVSLIVCPLSSLEENNAECSKWGLNIKLRTSAKSVVFSAQPFHKFHN